MSPKQWTYDEIIDSFTIRIRVADGEAHAVVITNAAKPPVGLPADHLEAPSLNALIDDIEEWYTTQTPPTEPQPTPDSDTGSGFRLRNHPPRETGQYIDISRLTPSGTGWQATRVTRTDAPTPLTPPRQGLHAPSLTQLLDALKLLA